MTTSDVLNEIRSRVSFDEFELSIYGVSLKIKRKDLMDMTELTDHIAEVVNM
jgi:hypothetical protein